MSDPLQVELLIVGAGPVGLYAAYYAGFRGLDTVVVESLPVVGGQIAAFYPEATLHDVPGFPAVRGDELVGRLLDQARAFPVALHLSETVHAISADGEKLRVASRTALGVAGGGEPRSYVAGAVLIAAGIGSFAPQRIKDPTMARFEGRGLAYDAADDALRGKRVLVLGGTSRAVDVSVRAAAVAADVTLLHRRDRLPGDGAGDRLAAAGVRFRPFSELVGLEGSATVERAVVEDRRSGTRVEMGVDAVLPCYGFAADAEPLRHLGVALDGDAVVADPRMATSLGRVHSAGDGTSYAGKVRILASGFGEACTAVNNLAATLVPGASVFPGYSSHRKDAARRPPPGPSRPG